MGKVNRSITALIAVLLLFIFSACSSTRNRTSSNTGSEKPLTNLSSSDLEKMFRDRFSSDQDLKNADIHVTANADKRDISLSGTVNSERTRIKAVQMAKSILPGFSVKDEIVVEPGAMARADFDEQQTEQERQAARSRGDSIGDSAEDVHIYMEIRSKLSASKADYQGLNIDVDKEVVTLRGTVASGNDKMEIQRIAQQVEGVKRVDNKLSIGNAAGQGQ